MTRFSCVSINNEDYYKIYNCTFNSVYDYVDSDDLIDCVTVSVSRVWRVIQHDDYIKFVTDDEDIYISYNDPPAARKEYHDYFNGGYGSG